MDWASEQSGILPKFGQLSIAKSSVADEQAFFDYVALCNLFVISVEPEYYILDGAIEDLDEFSKYWAD